MAELDKWNPQQSRDQVGRFGSNRARRVRGGKGRRKAQVGAKQHAHEYVNTKALNGEDMNTMRLFAQITKVDEAKRLVYGRAAQEVPDRADEILDYASSKPFFKEWSDGFANDTDGKSLGNLRAMHGKMAAGKLTAIDFNDDAKAIDIAAKIVDDNEWQKVQEGVYTGFSIGGSYVGDRIEEKIGDRTVKRYTAKPVEVSLVDSPCIPTARFFDVVKADGSVTKVQFKHEATIESSPEEVDAFTKLLNDNALKLGDVLKLVTEEIAAEAQEKSVRSMLATTVEIEAEKDVAKREFSADERKAAAKAGHALPDGSFPINSVGDLENAIRAFGRAKDKAAAKAHIIKRAKALGASDKIPEQWTKGDGEKVQTITLKKGLWSVSEFAECLQCLAQICRSAEFDLQDEGDDSPVPSKLRNCVDDLIEVFKEMTEEEADELLEELKEHAGVGEDDEIEEAMEQALRVGALRKRLADPDLPIVELIKIATEHEEPITSTVMADVPALAKRILAKAGARHSKLDMQHLQAAHDHLADLGAECTGTAEEKAARGTALQKKDADELVELRDRVKKLESRGEPFPYAVTLRAAPPKSTPGETGVARVDTPAGPINLTKDDYVLNPDGSVNMPATLVLKQMRPAAA